ncbi:MAG: hypothetical protein ACRD5H_10340 [Nitrososphaerales archaeon]
MPQATHKREYAISIKLYPLELEKDRGIRQSLLDVDFDGSTPEYIGKVRIIDES